MKKLLALLTLVFCFNCYSQQQWEYAEYQVTNWFKLANNQDVRSYELHMKDTTLYTSYLVGDKEVIEFAKSKFVRTWNTKLKGYEKLNTSDIKITSKIAVINRLGMKGWELISVTNVSNDKKDGVSYHFKRQVK